MLSRIWCRGGNRFMNRIQFLDKSQPRINVYSKLVLSCNRQKSSDAGNHIRTVLIAQSNPCAKSTLEIYRSFHTSKPTNALPPALVLLVSRVAKFGAALLGRSVRNWWKALPPERREKYIARFRKNARIFWAFIFSFFGGVLIYYVTHIEEAPVTGRKRFIAFNEEQFDVIAREEFKMLLQMNKDKIVPANPRNPAYNRVTKVAYRLLYANKDVPKIRDRQWTITVVDDESVQNAFVLPCGNIFVYTGMLEICEDDDDLGVVLGHEMAHAVLGHGAENASSQHLMDLLLIIPLAAIWTLVPTDAMAVFYSYIGSTLKSLMISLPYARELEREADDVGLRLAAKACFDVRVAPVFWAKMGYAAQKSGMPDVEFISTHPAHESRQAHLTEILPECLNLREQHNCPKLPRFSPEDRLNRFKLTVDSAKNHENLAYVLRVH